jgi:RNA polymerase sigma-70 factor (ECF subfamily)
MVTTLLDAAMDAFAAGDDAAFATVDALGRPILVRTLRRFTRDGAAAADLAQETLIRVLRSRARWRPGARVLPWAHPIARRRFLDDVRNRRARERAHEVLAQAGAPERSAPDEVLAARRALERIGHVVARLPPTQRAVFEQVVLDGESVVDTARRLGSAPVAIRVRLFRARRALAVAA